MYAGMLPETKLAYLEGEILKSIHTDSNRGSCRINQKRFCSPIVWVVPTISFSYLLSKTADLNKKQKLVYIASKFIKTHKNTLGLKHAWP